MDLTQATVYERLWEQAAWEVDRLTGAAVDDQAVERGELPNITTDQELDLALLEYFGVTLPNQRCCKGHRTPWEAFHDAFFARSPISIWKASRGFGGKSFTLATLGLAEALFLRADVNVLGGSGVQSKRVLEAVGKLWAHPQAPREKLKGSEPSSEVQRMVWGNRIQALMASQKSVRGPHPQRLRMDEVDEMKLDILDASLGQPMSRGSVLSQVVLSSTHQYPDGTMSKMLKRAGEHGWPVFEWCYRENLEPHGWLSQGEVERKRAVLTVQMWDTEIELQEPSSEGRAIVTEKVEQAFRSDVALEPPAVGSYVDGEWKPGGLYGTGADWAKKKNWTVIVTIRRDVRPMRVVAIRRTQREPWPAMAGYLDEQVAAYSAEAGTQGDKSTHDNTGIGQVVHDLLKHDSEPFNMVGRDRADLLSEYVAAIEHGELVWPKVEEHDTTEEGKALQAAYSEHKYATRDDLYKGSKDGTGKHHLPDTISAGALAWRAARDVVAVGGTQPPDPSDTPTLAAGIQRGRLSGQVFGPRGAGTFGRRGPQR